MIKRCKFIKLFNIVHTCLLCICFYGLIREKSNSLFCPSTLSVWNNLNISRFKRALTTQKGQYLNGIRLGLEILI